MSEPSPRLAPPSELLRGLSAYRAMLLRRRFARVALVCSWALASGFGLGLIGLAFGLASFPIVVVLALIAGASALVVGLRRWPAPSARDAALHGEAHSRAQGALALALEEGSVLLCSAQVEQALSGLKEAESRRPPLFPNLFPVFASLLSVVLLGSGLLVVWAAEIELIDLGPAPSAQATSETPSRRAQPTLNAEAMEELRASLLRKPAADASKAFQEQALREISVAAEKSKRRQEAAKEVLEALDANDAEKLREAKSALSAAISDNESQTLAESTDSALRELAEQVLRESESTLANLAQERAALRALAQRGEVENPRSEAGRVQAGQGKREVGEISTGAAQAVFIARDAWAKPSVRSADERNQSGAIVSRFRDSLRGKARD